ncbi:MAG: type II toxin-antitoxin system VapC family toxin [Verrucomicrobiota bacterium]
MTYFLDTNTVVFCLRGKSPLAMRRLCAIPAADVAVPLQVHAELLVGAAKSANPQQSKTLVTAFLARYSIAWPDAQVEDHYVAIRTPLESQGTSIGDADLWIAATVRALSGTVVTNNVREFSRVPRENLTTSQVIQKRTLAGLESAEHGHVNTVACVKLPPARDDLGLEIGQLQLAGQAGNAVKNYIGLKHNSGRSRANPGNQPGASQG